MKQIICDVVACDGWYYVSLGLLFGILLLTLYTTGTVQFFKLQGLDGPPSFLERVVLLFLAAIYSLFHHGLRLLVRIPVCLFKAVRRDLYRVIDYFDSPELRYDAFSYMYEDEDEDQKVTMTHNEDR